VLLRLEGQLIGPWVQDVEQCWRKTFLDPAFCGERERDSGALGADPRRDGADDWRLPRGKEKGGSLGPPFLLKLASKVESKFRGERAWRYKMRPAEG
jgi:hypothetical protein